MAVKDLGTKYTCFKCNTKFYDMRKPEPVCPKCGSDQRQSPALKPAGKRPKEKVPVPVVAEPEEALPDDADLEVEDADADEEEEEEDDF